MLLKKLESLGLEIPTMAPPVAVYVPARKHANAVYVSGQLPLKDSQLLMTGPMTDQRSMEEAQAVMAQCFLNGLAAALSVVDPGEITGVLKLGAYVASDPAFTNQHLVANGASNLAGQLFDEQGQHVRFAVGCMSLPLNATVELEITFTLGT